MRACLPALAALALFSAPPAFAAEDGVLGQTSTGTINVFMDISEPPPEQVQISRLTDITIGRIESLASDGSTLLGGSTSACIYHSSPSVSVTVSPALAAPFSSGYALFGPEPTPFDLLLIVNPNSGGFLGGPLLQPEIPVIVQANTSSPDCSTGPLSTLRVEVLRPQSSIAPGSYSAVLQIRLAVE